MNPHRRDCARFAEIAATAEAHEPVPEDCVSPTPRSKNLTSTLLLSLNDYKLNINPIFEVTIASDFGRLGLPVRSDIPRTNTT